MVGQDKKGTFGRASTFLGAAVLILGIATPTSAQFYVRSPEVSKGELEIEEHGAFYSGAGEDEHLNQTQ